MTEQFTDQMIRDAVAPDREEMLLALRDHDEVPSFMKTDDRFIEVWCAGCWLNANLGEVGATNDEISSIGFAHGQRSVFGNPYRWAAAYYNEFVTRGEVADKPGEKLAEEINDTHMQAGPGFVGIACEDPE